MRCHNETGHRCDVLAVKSNLSESGIDRAGSLANGRDSHMMCLSEAATSQSMPCKRMILANNRNEAISE